MKQFLETLGKLPRPYVIALSLTLFCVLASIDYLTGDEIAFSIFYSVPISLVAWFVGRGPGILLSILSAMAWLATDLMLGFDLEDAPIHFWNSTAGLGYFLVVTYALTALKRAWDREKELARMDGLTGIANRGYFYELAHAEAYRSHRYGHPISLAYLDLDNFKRINDDFGHVAGDELLRLIAATMRSNLRFSDIVARLGGDEFAILLPETGHEQAKTVMNALQKRMLDSLQTNGWSVTFSMGVITCQNLPCTVDEMIKMADILMYSAKDSGKNMIKFDRKGGK